MVPSGKKAWIEVIHVMVRRTIAATTPGIIIARVNYIPKDGATHPLVEVEVTTNTVNDRHIEHVPTAMLLRAGDTIEGQTVDTSTGGAALYAVVAKITEFDA